MITGGPGLDVGQYHPMVQIAAQLNHMHVTPNNVSTQPSKQLK